MLHLKSRFRYDWYTLYEQMTKFIYGCFVTMASVWMLISAYVFHQVEAVAGRDISNDSVSNLFSEKRIKLPVISFSFDELLMQCFMAGFLLVPVFILFTFVTAIANEKLVFKGLWAIVVSIVYVGAFFLLKTHMFGWYTGYLVD
jgi:hypothetical protein